MHTVGLATNHAGSGRKTCFSCMFTLYTSDFQSSPFSVDPFQQTLTVNNFIEAISVISGDVVPRTNPTMALNIWFWNWNDTKACKKQCNTIVIRAFNSWFCSSERPLPELSPALAITPFSSVKTLDHRNLPSSTLALALPVHSLRGSWQPCQPHL